MKTPEAALQKALEVHLERKANMLKRLDDLARWLNESKSRPPKHGVPTNSTSSECSATRTEVHVSNRSTSATIPFTGRSFTVRGVIDGHAVKAEASAGVLTMDSSVYDRAQLIVTLGDVFADPERGVEYAASLSGEDIGTTLTVIRAFDRITEVTMELDPS